MRGLFKSLKRYGTYFLTFGKKNKARNRKRSPCHRQNKLRLNRIQIVPGIVKQDKTHLNNNNSTQQNCGPVPGIEKQNTNSSLSIIATLGPRFYTTRIVQLLQPQYRQLQQNCRLRCEQRSRSRQLWRENEKTENKDRRMLKFFTAIFKLFFRRN